MARFVCGYRRSLRFLLAFMAAMPIVCGAVPPQPLSALNIDVGETSVSGLSSGGFMAVQFQVAYSSIVKGAGIVAAGPYFCAQNDVITAATKCSCTLDPGHLVCAVTPASADVAALVQATGRFADAGLIDDPANIAHQRVITFSGGKDETVPTPVVAQLGEYFTSLGVPAQNLSASTLANAGHAMPTKSFGSACAASAEPYLNRCQFDAAGKILNWIYGALKPARSGTRKGRFIQFDQTPFIPPQAGFSWSSGLDTSGWLYVPDTCAKGAKCRLHIALHGCKQGQSYLPLKPPPGGGLYYGTTFVKHAGYDAWADSNNLVILYPQAVTIPARNPNGCWDWWGYTDLHYADRQGAQIGALRAMVDKLGAGAH
jgi:poly(3-hydroxybutyrate) depolymerase